MPRQICRNVSEDFCCIKFGGFSRGFSWRIFLDTFSHKNEEKNPVRKSAKKKKKKIQRLKNKNPRQIRSAESRRQHVIIVSPIVGVKDCVCEVGLPKHISKTPCQDVGQGGLSLRAVFCRHHGNRQNRRNREISQNRHCCLFP